MHSPTENETWVVESGGAIIKKMADAGIGVLRPVERLIYCLWVADYGMRNAGDLDTAGDVYAQFQEDAALLAKQLKLEFTHEAFSLPKKTLEAQYLARFERICEEIKKAP